MKDVAELPEIDAEDMMFMRSLARKIAINIKPLDDILADLHLDRDAFELISAHQYFKKVLVEEAEAIDKAADAQDRIKHKYMSIIEESAAEVFRTIMDQRAAIAGRAELLKLSAKLAGLDARDGEAAAGRVVINIGISPDRNVQVSAPILDAIPEPEGLANRITDFLEQAGEMNEVDYDE